MISRPRITRLVSLVWLCLYSLGFVTAVACRHSGTADISALASNSDRLLFEAAEKEFAKHRWATCRQYLTRIKDGFAQSPLQPATRLMLADAYFDEGGTANYILAAAEYRDFISLYPSHARAAYAQLRLGESYYKQRSGVGRDQSSTVKAVAEYQRVLDGYPSSEFVDQARQRIEACRDLLARSDFLVGFFYQRGRKAYHSAVLRYEEILKEYPEYRRTDEVLFRLGECLVLSGRFAEALPQISRLIETFPTSEHIPEAKRLQDTASAAMRLKASTTPTPLGTPEPTPKPQ
jgi:outer membrane protein assembly factor BamD